MRTRTGCVSYITGSCQLAAHLCVDLYVQLDVHLTVYITVDLVVKLTVVESVVISSGLTVALANGFSADISVETHSDLCVWLTVDLNYDS